MTLSESIENYSIKFDVATFNKNCSTVQTFIHKLRYNKHYNFNISLFIVKTAGRGLCPQDIPLM